MEALLTFSDRVFLIQACVFLEEKCLSFILLDIIVKPDDPTTISNLDISQIGKVT